MRRWTEADRLDALERYKIMDTPSEADFDDIARIAAQICGVPMALVSLLDDKRQWFKAKLGLAAGETPREWAFCGHAIHQLGVFEVQDASRDPRFAENPLVTSDPSLRFYAGAPLETPDGFPLGTLCVLDSKPHQLTEDQRSALLALARQVMTQMEHRRLLAQQQADEARHRQILHSAIDYAIVTMDLSGRITSWNEGARRILQWAEEEMCGRLCDEFFTPEDREAGQPAKEMGAALRSGFGTDERWHLRKDGERFWANGEMMPLVDDDGIPVGFLKILRDRTEQRLSREKLESTERRFELAVEAAELGTWEAVPALRQLEWDARTRELLGVGTDHPLEFGKSFTEVIHPDDRGGVAAAVAYALEEGADNRLDIEYRVFAPGGKFRSIHARGRLIESDGQPARLVGTVRDVTARAQAEEHREMLTNELQHRVKNTLAVVQGIVSQSLRTAATPMQARDAIGDRLASLARAHDLLTQTSWIAAPMVSIVEGAVAVAGAHKGRVHLSGPDVALKPRAALALAMALHELTTNAIKYGALSKDQGYVDMRWAYGDAEGRPVVEVVWQEVGGPMVSKPTREGFGTRLMTNGLRSDLGGEGVLSYLSDGVRWTLQADRSVIEEA
ncbi:MULTISPECIES: PAS domain S-box protein [unclassified Novosphingobium]|uniref:PAS domain S-box protein n=1 Tax=unclassified Novosphingobium TaxID=2644732 RepID=UPI001357FED0|nr:MULTISPECIES: PAS domain S-box protein [unclassified Novosphingobium]